MSDIQDCQNCDGTGQYLDRENWFVRPCPECNEDAGVESLDELPDHPNDRVWPGFDNDNHLFITEKIVQFYKREAGQLHGFIAVASDTVQVLGPDDPYEAANQALKSHNAADLKSYAIDMNEADKKDDEIYREGYYDDYDGETTLYEVDLIGAGRFYGWGDDADIGEVAPHVIHTGDYSHCGVVTTWLAKLHEVDKERLCVERQHMKRVLQQDPWDDGE